MRIAYVLGSFPVLSETFIGNEIRGMEALGHEIHITAFDRPDADAQPDDEILAERTVYMADLDKKMMIPSREARRFVKKQTHLSTHSLLYNSMKLAAHIEASGCMHIHTHFAWGNAAHAIVAAKLLDIPITMTCHGSDIVATPQDVEAKLDAVNAVITVSEEMRKRLAEQTDTPIHLIPSSVDIDAFQSSPLSNGKLLFIGRLIDCKGVDDLLHVLAALPIQERPELDIVGDGPLRDDLEQLAMRLQLKNFVKFRGSQPQSWIKEYAPLYHAFIAPFREGKDGMRDASPTVLKEAMAMGLPIITTRFLSIPDIIDPACTFLVDPSDYLGLMEVISQIRTLHDDKRLTMGKKSREAAAAKHSITKQCQRLSELFREVA